VRRIAARSTGLPAKSCGREFAAAAEWLSGLGVPVSVEPGNHDIPYYWEPLTRLRRTFERYGVLRAAVHRDLVVEGAALVSLQTIASAQWRLNLSKGMVKPAALTRALDGLAGAQSAGLRLVACHHPLIDAGTKGSGSTRGGRQALAALAQAGAHAVLSGHVHDAFDRQIETEGGPIRIIGAGTLSQRLRASRPSYNQLEWNAAAGLTVSVRHAE
jgi:3',5'-cyclic AMP phosphodiesterase CpdA